MKVGDVKWAVSHYGKIHKVKITGRDHISKRFSADAVDGTHTWVMLTESSVYNSKFEALVIYKLGL